MTSSLDPQDVTTRALLGAAPSVMAELGWRDAAVEVLCRKEGVAIDDFYERFATLDDLFVTIYAAKQADQLEIVRGASETLVAISPPISPDDLPTHVARAMSRLPEERTWWLAAADYAVRAARHPAVAERYRRVRQEGRAAMEAEFRRVLARLGLADEAGTAARLVSRCAAMRRGAIAEALLGTVQSSADYLDRVDWTTTLGLAAVTPSRVPA